MTSPKPASFLSIVFTALAVCALIISCNNSTEDKTTPAKDTIAPVIVTPDSTKLKNDSTKMDSADTKPVKTTN